MRPIEQVDRERIEFPAGERATAALSSGNGVILGRQAGAQVLVGPTHDMEGATVELRHLSGPPGALDAGSESSLEIGRVLRDRYVIQDRLGSGGRGTVFSALDRYRSSLPDAEQHVALKVLHTSRDCCEQTIKDLRRELHCGQVLSHPNIVNVYELDRDGDVIFFTMELLDGELLSDVLGRMRPAAMQRLQALQIIRQLGAGLAHAHERGVVHGDLKPRNLLITRKGQLRILDFGAAQTTVAQPQSDQRASMTGTPAYASCEMLEGRTANACDDLYALACICYELLSVTHPFAARPATIARDFGVRATRPAGLTGRQWRTLQRGLSWHRAGRSMGVHAFIQGLTHHIAEKPTTTPLKDLAATGAPKPWLRSRAAAVSMAVLVIAGVCISQLRETSAGKISVEAATRPMPDTLMPSPVMAPTAEPPAPAVPSDEGAWPAAAKAAVDGTSQARPAVRLSPAAISVDGYQVSMGDRFVEIRVHRDGLQRNASFAWWTEPATAKQDVDYVHQAKAIQTFAPEQRSTRFYVKLLPESGRSKRDYFYVAIAQSGRARGSENVKRVQIWLPTARDHMQASR